MTSPTERADLEYERSEVCPACACCSLHPALRTSHAHYIPQAGATLALYDGAQCFHGPKYSLGCQFARLHFPKAERQQFDKLAANLCDGMQEAEAGITRFIADESRWEKCDDNPAYGMVLADKFWGGAEGETARDEMFMNSIKGARLLSSITITLLLLLPMLIKSCCCEFLSLARVQKIK